MKTNTIKEYLWIHAINVHDVSNSIAERPCKKSLCQEDVFYGLTRSQFCDLMPFEVERTSFFRLTLSQFEDFRTVLKSRGRFVRLRFD